MAGPNLTYHQPISAVETVTGLTPFNVANPEKAGQTFPIGVPVQINAGYTQVWDGTTLTAGIAGFSLTYGLNLASNGYGAPGAFAQVGPPGSIQVYGNVPNQPAAVNIAVGAPISDGRTYFESSAGMNIFEANFDDSTGTTAANYTPLQSQIGTQFGLTVDANNQWYVDNAKTTPGTNTVVLLVGINPIDQVPGAAGTYIVNARVRFQVLAAARQLES
jgi:hypothetical protein